MFTSLVRSGPCLLGALLWLASVPGTLAAEDASLVENRLSQSAQHLSSDELEGRGVGTRGLDLAADYIAAQFREIGLTTELYGGTPFQKFKMTVGASLGPHNALTLVGPSEKPGQEPRQVE